MTELLTIDESSSFEDMERLLAKSSRINLITFDTDLNKGRYHLYREVCEREVRLTYDPKTDYIYRFALGIKVLFQNSLQGLELREVCRRFPNGNIARPPPELWAHSGGWTVRGTRKRGEYAKACALRECDEEMGHWIGRMIEAYLVADPSKLHMSKGVYEHDSTVYQGIRSITSTEFFIYETEKDCSKPFSFWDGDIEIFVEPFPIAV